MAKKTSTLNKFLTGSATAAMVATAIVPVAAANTDTAADTIYSDVSANNTHYENILEAKTLELLSGYTDGTFKPGAKLTRSNVVKALGKYVIAKSGKEIQDYDVAGVTPFNDVTAEHPDKELYNYSLIVKKAGVFSGSNNNLLPTNLITRQQMAKVAVNAFGLKDLPGDLSKVTDNNTAQAEFRPFIDILSENGVTTEESFRPTENVRRDQFASFLVRAYEIANPVVGAPEVLEVSAINGSVVAKFNTTPKVAPVSSDFVVTRSINGGATTTVTPTNVAYNEATKAVTFTVPEVAQTNAAQTVTYSVKYKDDAAKSASFTVAALAIPAIQAVAAADTNTITLVFNRPVDIATAENEANYSLDSNVSKTTDIPVFPTSATVRTTSAGPYAGNQIVTLQFAGTNGADTDAIVANVAAALTISNLKEVGGTAVPTTTLDITPVGTVGDTSPTTTDVPVITDSLTNGAQTSDTGINANAGNTVSLNVATTADAEIASVRYRLLKPDNTLTSWTSVKAEDGRFDELSETVVAPINTTGFAGGTYGVIVEVTDAVGRVTTTAPTALSLNIVANDITAPGFTATAGTYNNTTRRVEVEGTATDTNSVSNIASVQYRVQTFNATTGAFTTSTDWTNASATDGTFNEKSESFNFESPQLDNSTQYRIQVRSTDAAGNTSLPKDVNVTGASVNGTTFTTPVGGDRIPPVAPSINSFTIGGAPFTGGSTNQTQVRIAGNATDQALENTTARVSNVEVAVFRDATAAEGFETEVRPYSSVGVTAVDGGFNSANEDFVANLNLPAVDGDYLILVRTVDAAGNKGASVSRFVTVDTTSPTVTLVPNTDNSPENNDYIVTFSEAVEVGTTASGSGLLVSDNVTSGAVNDPDNYTVQQGAQVTDNNIQSIRSIGLRQYIITFETAPTSTPAQTINISSVEDLAGNAIAPKSFTVSQ